jgi:hypothetical protein
LIFLDSHFEVFRKVGGEVFVFRTGKLSRVHGKGEVDNVLDFRLVSSVSVSENYGFIDIEFSKVTGDSFALYGLPDTAALRNEAARVGRMAASVAA